MISSFNCKDSKKVFEGETSRKLPAEIQRRARMKLLVIDAATCLEELRTPASNHLEKLVGTRSGENSIRINAQWRITFKYDGNFHDVAIEDYH